MSINYGKTVDSFVESSCGAVRKELPSGSACNKGHHNFCLTSPRRGDTFGSMIFFNRLLRRFLALWPVALSIAIACSRTDSGVPQQRTSARSSPAPARTSAPAPTADVARTRSDGYPTSIGFRSRAQFDEHFQKHGAEFGRITAQEYLREAQNLRDAPAGGEVEEIRRDDGTVSRFDRSTGAFVAFNRDGTIRTFFKPNDGEAYFRRQASRVH